MNILQIIILGAVEGLTEFLPISSTAHLVLVGRALGLVASPSLTTFTIAIQVGAILAVLSRYWKRLFSDWALVKNIAVAFLPTAIIGAAAAKTVTGALLASTTVSIVALGVGGLALIFFARWHKERSDALDDLSRLQYRTAFFIGCWQAVAVIPGVSRAAATIVGGLILGLKRRTIVEFSFLLALPTLIGATALDLFQNRDILSSGSLLHILLGAAAAFFFARLAVNAFLRFVERGSFMAFGVYRVIIAVVSWLFLR